MNDEELTKLAVEQLIAEGRKFARKRELKYTLDEPSRMRPNLKYFKNTLNLCISSNKRLEREKQSTSGSRKDEKEKKKRKYKNPELSKHPTYEKRQIKTEKLRSSSSQQSETQKSSKSELRTSDDQKKRSKKVSSTLINLKKKKKKDEI